MWELPSGFNIPEDVLIVADEKVNKETGAGASWRDLISSQRTTSISVKPLAF
jgi:hypothetical protein